MNDYINIVKLNLADKLEKMGSSLEEFENFLTHKPEEIEKVASFLKEGKEGLFGLAGSALEAAALSSFLTGSLGGGLAYGLKSHLTNKDEEIADKQQEIARINFLTKRLKAANNIK